MKTPRPSASVSETLGFWQHEKRTRDITAATAAAAAVSVNLRTTCFHQNTDRSWRFRLYWQPTVKHDANRSNVNKCKRLSAEMDVKISTIVQ